MSTRSTLVGEMSDSDAVLWTIGRDPVLRSPILAVMLLDEEPDWEMGLARVEKLTVIEPRLRARAVAPPGACSIWPSSWEPTRSTRSSRCGSRYWSEDWTMVVPRSS